MMLFAFAVMYARGSRWANTQSGPEDSSSGTPSIFKAVAFHILEQPDFKVFIPQHVFTLVQN